MLMRHKEVAKMNRRKWKRAALMIPARLKTPKGDRMLLCRDVSPEGMGFSGAQDLSPGQLVWIELLLSDKTTVEVVGRAVHVSGGGRRFGVCCKELKPRLASEIAVHLMSQGGAENKLEAT